MIVKIRGEERSDNWWFFEAGTVHYNHVMLSVNEIDHGVVHKDDEGKITGMHGLGIKKHIIDSEHVPAWKLVRFANERSEDPRLDEKHPFVLMELIDEDLEGHPDMKILLFNTIAYLCNDKGETIEKITPDRHRC